jgi:hypothetical protein
MLSTPRLRAALLQPASTNSRRSQHRPLSRSGLEARSFRAARRVIHQRPRRRVCAPDRRGWGRRPSEGGRPPFETGRWLQARRGGAQTRRRTSCYAAGWNQDTSFNNAVLLEHWNGTSWSIQTPTLPASTTASKLLDISCTSDTACTAVGYYEATGQPRRPLVEVWDGTSWTPQTAATNVSGQLQGVECDGASRCMAVGIYWDNSTGVQHHLAESRSGTTWTRLSVPDPSASGATDPYLEDVSCITSPSYACHAVGHYLTSGSRGAPTIASWNGTSWSLASSIGTPSGTTDNVLYGISCTTSCMAVGGSVYSALSGTRPWVELGP